jgi:hypothetical protein
MLPANRVLIVALAFVAASGCMYLAFQFASLALPVLMRMSASPHSWIVPLIILLVIMATANQRRRGSSRKFPR